MSNPLGRPTDYTDGLAAYICSRIASGETITSICRGDEDMPDLVTIWRWREAHEDFRNSYARAIEAQSHVFAAEITDLAKQPLQGEKIEEGEDATRGPWRKRTIGDNVERTKLMIDSRKWFAARVNPKAYGDRTAIQALDEKGNPTKPGITVIIGGAENE